MVRLVGRLFLCRKRELRRGSKISFVKAGPVTAIVMSDSLLSPQKTFMEIDPSHNEKQHWLHFDRERVVFWWLPMWQQEGWILVVLSMSLIWICPLQTRSLIVMFIELEGQGEQVIQDWPLHYMFPVWHRK